MTQESALDDEIVNRPDPEFVESTNVRAFMEEYDIDEYDDLVQRTTTDISGVDESGVDWFWDEIVDYLDIEFYDDYDTVRDDSDGPQFSNWYPGGTINIAHNALDRHAGPDTSRRNSVACVWEGEPGDVRNVTYHELHRRANQVANYLDTSGIGEGDTVGLYMPMVPEVIAILYGVFKVGAIAVPIFSGFGVDATATRIGDAECSVLFTADGFYRRGDQISLKETADDAIQAAGHVDHTVVYNRLDTQVVDESGAAGDTDQIPWNDSRDLWWSDGILEQDDSYETTPLPADHESMLLYSSGTTGMPKGIVHTHAGAQVQCAKEIHFGFDLKAGDRFFWVSDIGWMMGPWMLIGAHTFGNTVFMYEGAPDHPEPDRFWAMIDRHKLTQFGVSPTAVRALRKHGDEWIEDYDLSSLRLLGSTGEPWDTESWEWFHEHVGGGECPIINISGGTEVFGCFLMPMPTEPLKPCTLGGPGLGMAIDIVDHDGESVRDDHERGFLVARDSCPSMTKSLWCGDDRYLAEYWSTWPDLWDHGDWAQVDEDGFWFLHGRADDAINVAGRKVGPAEIEDVLIDHEAVNQSAAVGVPDDTTGTAVITYVILEPNVEESESLRATLRERVGDAHGKPFRPREVLFVDSFPKTQSGKIIRRAIEAAYTGEDLGNLSSLENPGALENVKNAR